MQWRIFARPFIRLGAMVAFYPYCAAYLVWALLFSNRPCSQTSEDWSRAYKRVWAF